MSGRGVPHGVDHALDLLGGKAGVKRQAQEPSRHALGHGKILRGAEWSGT